MNDVARIREIISDVRKLASEYYRLTGKPLGVTGEVAELVAAELMQLELAPARTPGYDAIRRTKNGDERIQIKGRALVKGSNPSQRLGTIKTGAACDVVMVVLLDISTLEPLEIWEASYQRVIEELAKPGSKARERGALGLQAFKKIATRVWRSEELANASATKDGKTDPRICPECGHVFRGRGWDGIDAHWRSAHEDVMPYEEAWRLLSAGTYVPTKPS